MEVGLIRTVRNHVKPQTQDVEELASLRIPGEIIPSDTGCMRLVSSSMLRMLVK
jgi:hypothetical protein